MILTTSILHQTPCDNSDETSQDFSTEHHRNNAVLASNIQDHIASYSLTSYIKYHETLNTFQENITINVLSPASKFEFFLSFVCRILERKTPYRQA